MPLWKKVLHEEGGMKIGENLDSSKKKKCNKNVKDTGKYKIYFLLIFIEI